MASRRQPVSAPAFGDGIAGYAAFKDHAQRCDHCLGDLTLALISIVVTGELVFHVTLCSEGERLLANVSRALAQRDIVWPNSH